MKKLIAILIVLLVSWMAFALYLFTAQETHSIFSDTSSSKVVLPPTSNEVEAAINEWRVDQGLTPFNSEVPALDQAAQVRAENMCAENNWSHSGNWDVLVQYYPYIHAGENLYYGELHENQATSAVRDWVASPSHLEALVSDYSEIGVGVKSCPGFQGSESAVIITNYFGVPR